MANTGIDYGFLVTVHFFEDAVSVHVLDSIDVVLVLAFAITVGRYPVEVHWYVVLGKRTSTFVRPDDGFAARKRCTHSISHDVSELVIVVVTNYFVAQPKAKDFFILQQLRCLGHDIVPPLLIVRVHLAVVDVPVAEELRDVIKEAQVGPPY